MKKQRVEINITDLNGQSLTIKLKFCTFTAFQTRDEYNIKFSGISKVQRRSSNGIATKTKVLDLLF